MNLLDIGKSLVGNFQQSASRNPIISAIQGGLQQGQLASINYQRQRALGQTPGQQIMQRPINVSPRTANFINSGNRFLTSPTIQQNPIMQFGSGLISGQNLGMTPAAQLPTRPMGKLAYGAGSLIGAMNPKSLTGRVITPIVRGTNPIIAKSIGPIANRAVAGRLAAGVGNVVQGTAINPIYGRKPLEGAALDFVSGVAFGPNQFKNIAKGMAPGRNRTSTWSGDELGMLDQINDFLKQNKTIKNFQAAKLDDRITYLAKSHIPNKVIEKLATDYGSNEVGFMKALTNELLKDSRRSPVTANYNWDLGMGIKAKSPSVITKQSPQKLMAQSEIPQVSKTGQAAIKQVEQVGDMVSGGSGVKPPDTLARKSSKYAYNINKNRLQLNTNEKKTLNNVVNTITPELEKAKGKKLGNKEVVEAAKKSEILTKVTTRDETLQANAAMLKARQKLVSLDKEVDALAKSGNAKQLEAKMKDLVDSLRVVSSEAADRGRKLQSLSIGAEDESVRTTLLKEISRVETDTDRIVKEAANVDWENANAVSKFYRKFIKPSTTEILDEYRYNNMLSNPRTHIRNAFSNLVQTYYTRPATKLLSGDVAGAGKYYAGSVKALPKATQAFIDSMSGKKAIAKPDLEHIPTFKLPKFMTIPTKAMEAGDAFFSTLIREGELASGTKPELAEELASYSLFRGGLNPKGQGKLLNAIDSATEGVYQMGNKVPLLRWFMPFVRTPMNFAKQWVEYSPAGLATLPGAANKKEQLAKVLLGSGVSLMGAQLALNGNTTWAAPTDKKQKDLFYASGRKPFSIRVGDKWVSMMYAGPFAYALALPAAVKYYQDEDRKALTDTQLQKLGKITSSMAEYLSGQTFMEGLGNFVGLLKGDADYTVGKNLAYTASQFIPMQGLVKYITQVIDPVYRQAKSPVEQIKTNLPFISKSVKPYTLPSGEPEVRERINLVTPYDLSTIRPEYEAPLQDRTQQLQKNAVINQAKKQVEETGESRTIDNKLYYLDGDTVRTKTLKEEADTTKAPKKAKAKAAKKVTIKKLTASKFKLKKSKRLKMAKLPKPKITKTKGYKILTYTDKTPTVKIAKPTMKWS